MIKTIFSLSVLIAITACSPVRDNFKISDGHIKNSRGPGLLNDIPPPVSVSPALPIPQPSVVEPTHTVVVSDISIKELLFELTRDANLNLDIDDNITDTITINAIDQTFNAILERIANTANLRYEKKNGVLNIRRDTPFLKNYRIDYLNMSRSSSTTVSVATELGSTGRGGVDSGSSSEGSNSSNTEVTSSSDNNFWKTLEENIATIIDYKEPTTSAIAKKPDARPEQKASPGTSITNIIGGIKGNTEPPKKEAASNTSNTADGKNKHIAVNKEAGIISIRATKKQHKKVAEFITEITTSAQRQVLIEATIAEVTLNDSYQAGIDWSLIDIDGNVTTSIAQSLTGAAISGLNISSSETKSGGDKLDIALEALETFGDVSVVSSPKVMALNNQTALLKVVDNIVYFTLDVDIQPGENGSNPIITFDSEAKTIPVGFVMTVTPFINDKGAVTLNVRPTISRVIGQATDPNPSFAEAGVVSQVPIVQVREVESVLKVNSGDVAIIGGLMQDELNESTESTPLLSSIPYVGSLFSYQNDSSTKTELVIFLKPIVVNHASVNTDLASFKKYLPLK